MDKLRILQIALLDLAVEIDRICKKNVIHYSLCGGSLLGAVRHKGFIPWDDDMDIAMLRSDYERFIELCSKELDSEYFIQSPQTDPYYANSFAKLGIKGTTLINPMIENQKVKQCISVDIFPLDVLPASKWKKKIQYYREQDFCVAAYLKAGYQIAKPVSIPGKIRRSLVKSYSKHHELCQILENQIKWEKKYNTNAEDAEVGIVFFKESYTTEKQFLNQIDGQFEGHCFNIPREYDSILHGIYGNYLELPPIEKRIAHNFTELDLGTYNLRNQLVSIT